MNINNLKKFIDRAEKNRKYAPNTASGIRVALGYFENELNEEERESLDKLKTNFNAIYSSVMRNNQDKLAVASLEIYKRRVAGLIRDYEHYANDASKFINWTPAARTTKSKKDQPSDQIQNPTLKNALGPIVPPPTEINELKLVKSEIPLRPGVKAIVLIPEDLNQEDVRKIRAFADYLFSLTGLS